MDFNELVKTLQEFVGVSRKNSIEKVTKTLGEVYNISGEVLLDFGDDASAIDIGQLLTLAIIKLYCLLLMGFGAN